MGIGIVHFFWMFCTRWRTSAHRSPSPAPSANLLTVQAATAGAFAIFTVTSGVSVGISALTISNGSRGISNSGTVTATTAYYMTLARDAGIPVESFVFIVVEKEPPFGMALYTLDADDLEMAMNERRALLRAFAVCQANDDWPC